MHDAYNCCYIHSKVSSLIWFSKLPKFTERLSWVSLIFRLMKPIASLIIMFWLSINFRTLWGCDKTGFMLFRSLRHRAPSLKILNWIVLIKNNNKMFLVFVFNFFLKLPVGKRLGFFQAIKVYNPWLEFFLSRIMVVELENFFGTVRIV